MQAAIRRLAPVLVGLAVVVPVAMAQEESEIDYALDELLWEIDVASGAFELLVPFPSREGVSFVWGDIRGVLRRSVHDGEELREVWKSFPLDGNPREIFLRDLDRDGSIEMIAYTPARVYVWETEEFSLVWESVDYPFESITAMAIENVDEDPELEIIACADERITYFDGVDFIRERTGRDRVHASKILVDDVDGDGALEIVTDDGWVLDSHNITAEWAHSGFGYPMRLVDLDLDGVPELIGEHAGGLQIWNLRDRVEIW